MRKEQIVLMILSCLCVVSLGGCLAAAVGVGAAGTVAYVRGDLEAVEAKTLDELYKAAVKAVDELELALISKSKDALSAEIIARDAEDKKIRINLTSTAEGATKVTIRVGTFGSQTKSRAIYEKIKENL